MPPQDVFLVTASKHNLTLTTEQMHLEQKFELFSTRKGRGRGFPVFVAIYPSHGYTALVKDEICKKYQPILAFRSSLGTYRYIQILYITQGAYRCMKNPIWPRDVCLHENPVLPQGHNREYQIITMSLQSVSSMIHAVPLVV